MEFKSVLFLAVFVTTLSLSTDRQQIEKQTNTKNNQIKKKTDPMSVK